MNLAALRVTAPKISGKLSEPLLVSAVHGKAHLIAEMGWPYVTTKCGINSFLTGDEWCVIRHVPSHSGFVACKHCEKAIKNEGA